MTQVLAPKTLLDAGVGKHTPSKEPFSSSLVFIGNPGSGKSSLVNCLAQKLLFRSGMSSDGVGVTAVLEEKIFNDKRYMDTPGLSDIHLRKAAAKAIDEVLQTGGKFQICFVIKLQNNRVQADDITTMKLVMDAAKQLGQDSYSIVINQMHPKELKKLNMENFFKNLDESLTLKGCQPTRFKHVIPLLDELDKEDDAICELPSAAKEFIAGMPVITMDPSVVEDVNADDFDDLNSKIMEAEALLASERAAKAEAEKEAQKAQEQARQEAKAKEEAEAARIDAENREKEEQKARIRETEARIDAENRQKEEQKARIRETEARIDAENREREQREELEAQLEDERQNAEAAVAQAAEAENREREQREELEVQLEDERQHAEAAVAQAAKDAVAVERQQIAALNAEKEAAAEDGKERNATLKRKIKRLGGIPLTTLLTRHFYTIHAGDQCMKFVLGGCSDDPWIIDDVKTEGKKIEIDGIQHYFHSRPYSCLAGGAVLVICQRHKPFQANQLGDLALEIGSLKVGVTTVAGPLQGGWAKLWSNSKQYKLDFSDADCPNDPHLLISINVRK